MTSAALVEEEAAVRRLSTGGDHLGAAASGGCRKKMLFNIKMPVQ